MEEKQSKTQDTRSTEGLSYFEQWKQFQYWNYKCQLERWVYNHQNHLQTAITYHQYHVQQQYQGTNTEAQQSATTATSFTAQQQQQQPLPPADYRIPGLMYRVAAEFIDCLILASIKMLIFWVIMYTTGFVISDVGFQVLFTNKLQLMDVDVEDLLTDDEVQTMMALTVFYRLCSCLYEFLFIWKLSWTPGKYMMGLRVVEARSFNHQNDGTLTLNPGTTPSAVSSWNRCFVKNLSIAFLVPSFFTAFYYSYSRTSYDIVSNTVVVKKSNTR